MVRNYCIVKLSKMRRSYIIALMLMLTSTMMASIHTYVDKSVLKDGRFVKISVKESGIHSISYDALKEWGIEPTNVAILGYGGAMMSENFMLTRWDDLPSVAFICTKVLMAYLIKVTTFCSMRKDQPNGLLTIGHGIILRIHIQCWVTIL